VKTLTRVNQDLFIGLVRLHVLHHASIDPIFGLGIVNELARHGYRLGPGTIYPLLRSMERRGWLKAKAKVVDGRRRIFYSATHSGQAALMIGRQRVRELYEEMCAN
jgi:DNA-binding PadR family transcriptional regulator